MMKRILVITMLSFALSIQLFAQCTIDTSLHNPGVYPDSATGFASGVINTPYSQVIQVVVPADTTITTPFGPITIPIDSVHLASFTGLPPGLSLSCNPAGCTYTGGSNGCAVISGTPTDTGHFQLSATVTTYAGGGLITQNNTVDYYSIYIATTIGLAEFSSNQFAVKQNTPNPFSQLSVITYNIPNSGKVEFKMYNLLGKQIYHSTDEMNAGVNAITVDGSKYAPGAYMYSLIFDNQTITKSLVISER